MVLALNRQIDKLSGIENPDMCPWNYSYLIFEKYILKIWGPWTNGGENLDINI